MAEFADILETARDSARQAGAIALSYRNRAAVDHKGGKNNLVTEADLLCERRIRELVAARFPDHAFLGEEEGGDTALEAEHLWVIDPIDGTNNYAHGISQFAVSVAYAYRGIVTGGVVYDPVHDELFEAARGQGARLNGESLAVSARPLDEALIGTGFHYDRGEIMARTLRAVEALFRDGIRGIRRMGSAALDLCFVACGRFDGFFEYRLSPWDFAAAILILEEAGGALADAAGQPFSLASRSVCAGNQKVFPRLIEFVKANRPHGEAV